MSHQYIMQKCQQCGTGIPVNLNQRAVTCNFCGAEYEVVKRHGQRINGQFGLDALLIAGIGGFIFGGIVFTEFGRSLAKSAIKRGARLAGVAEERVEEWARG